MTNRFQHLIDAAQHQFGELGKQQIQKTFRNEDGVCYLGSYLVEMGRDAPFPSHGESLEFFKISGQDFSWISNWNDEGISWQEISERLERHGRDDSSD